VRSVDYDVDEATFRVKKRMTHTVKTMYFDERTKQVLLDYEKMTPIVDAGTLNRRLSRYDKRMGYRIYPHLFRHTTITQFRKVLAKLYPDTWEYLIKQIAGHTSKDMTDYYTDPAVFQSELKEAMTKNHWMKEVKIKW
jgi:integrase